MKPRRVGYVIEIRTADHWQPDEDKTKKMILPNKAMLLVYDACSHLPLALSFSIDIALIVR